MTFAILGAKPVSNVGASTVYGDIGVSPSQTISGIETIKRTGGDIHLNDSTAIQAQKDSMTAYSNLQNVACDHDLSGQDLGGMTLLPGTYCFSGPASLNGILTLNALGDAHASFTFQVSTTLTAGANSGIKIMNSGLSCNVFWQVGQSATLQENANFAGEILAVSDITLQATAKLNGKVVSQSGTITLDSSEIYNNFCPWW